MTSLQLPARGGWLAWGCEKREEMRLFDSSFHHRQRNKPAGGKHVFVKKIPKTVFLPCVCSSTFSEDAVLVIPLLQPALLRRHLSWPAVRSGTALTSPLLKLRVLKASAEAPPPPLVTLAPWSMSGPPFETTLLQMRWSLMFVLN